MVVFPKLVTNVMPLKVSPQSLNLQFPAVVNNSMADFSPLCNSQNSHKQPAKQINKPRLFPSRISRGHIS